jgi:CRP-like cAMP-binding protein
MTIASLAPLSFVPSAKQFAAHHHLTLSFSHVWQIEAGFVRTVTWSEDGTLVVLGIWGAGDVVGRALTKINPLQIECLTKVQASLVAIDSLPHLSDILLTHLHYSEELMLIRGSKRADLMLVRLLSWLADRFGQTTRQGKLINLRLTHRDLAELLGTTRVTITRILNQLEQQKYIQRLPLQQIVLQEEALWHYEI